MKSRSTAEKVGAPPRRARVARANGRTRRRPHDVDGAALLRALAGLRVALYGETCPSPPAATARRPRGSHSATPRRSRSTRARPRAASRPTSRESALREASRGSRRRGERGACAWTRASAAMCAPRSARRAHASRRSAARRAARRAARPSCRERSTSTCSRSTRHAQLMVKTPVSVNGTGARGDLGGFGRVGTPRARADSPVDVRMS